MAIPSAMKTEDGITVKTGALIWYVNYLGEIKPVVFNMKGKSTVKYFSLHENAEKFLRECEQIMTEEKELRLSELIKSGK
jgi:hypothetical protein